MEFRITAGGYTSVHTHTLAIEHVAWTVRQIWEVRRRRYYAEDNPDVVRVADKVVGRVHHARNQHYSSNVHESVETPPLSLALDDAVSFFQFRFITVNHEDLTKPTRILGWAHPALVALLRYHGTTIIVDGTFRCVPTGYAQCVVFMVHDRASGVFVPVFYILNTARTGASYWDMIYCVVQATDQQIEPTEVVYDLEPGLTNALQTHVPNAIALVACIATCYEAVRYPRGSVSFAVAPSMLDTLTVVKLEQVKRGIKWAKREVKQRYALAHIPYSTEKWAWLEFDPIDVWNVHGLNNELIARTNNTLERFNRELNTKFPTPRPSMATLVTVIKTLSSEYVRRVANVPRGRARRVQRERIVLPEPIAIPEAIDSDTEDQAAAAAFAFNTSGATSVLL
ncbi:hypothetical protein PHMEG_00013211 [Phytophthora megakarya]|uniref:MULE transposase domain-containing protein n=1 Tax=Phytophthora megakarya TaxID=4795 RepID=A0A225W8H7_9STRA|nr:hypothetical protein PHMEG_00013211 [Phytophthora megakarya]